MCLPPVFPVFIILIIKALAFSGSSQEAFSECLFCDRPDARCWGELKGMNYRPGSSAFSAQQEYNHKRMSVPQQVQKKGLYLDHSFVLWYSKSQCVGQSLRYFKCFIILDVLALSPLEKLLVNNQFLVCCFFPFPFQSLGCELLFQSQGL